MGLLGKSYDPYGGMTSLLGIDQGAMRKQALFNGLAAAGFTLMGDRNPGNAGLAFVAGTDRARDDYYRTAMDAYRLKQAEEDRNEDRAWRDKQWEYQTGRQSEADEMNRWRFGQEQEAAELAESQRLGQQSAVNQWSQGFEQQGGNLFSPEMQAGLRQQGIQGVEPRDSQKYQRMQPYMSAQDYGGAFQQMMAEPAAQEGFTLGKDQTRFDAYGNPIATGGGGAMLPDWKETTLEDGVYWVDQNNPQNRVKIGDRPNRNEGEGREFTQEGKLRAEYEKAAKPFTDLRVNYQKIQAASQDNTGASDIAMVYSFMKMLDPTSVVREGEFATAENAGGVPTQIMTMYNRALTGQRLSPEIRQQFLQQSGRQYEQQMATYEAIRAQYAKLAEDYGISPDRVTPDLSYGVQVQQQPGVIQTEDGYTIEPVGP